MAENAQSRVQREAECMLNSLEKDSIRPMQVKEPLIVNFFAAPL